MVLLLTRKVVAITGCGTGIGRAIALECARQGARLVLHHIGDAKSSDDISSLQREIGSFHGSNGTASVTADVSDPDAGQRIVDAAISSFGEINVAINNAGMCQFLDFSAVTAKQLDSHTAVNFHGPFAITQAVVEQMKKQGTGGSIVSIASITATMGSSQLAHYAATKAAIQGMSVSCAVALGRYGIRFNTVSPGTIETAMNKADLRGAKRSEMEKRVPLGRLGVPEDVAKPVVFFASDMAQYVSGQNLIVDGAASVNYQ
ncbi:hypothetical protein D6D06_09714 [Aureobasidium pullulans]|nr:hypothetical protein D6D06_09714 [Aureobasidium pullulans]THX67515.1 hypothetical protein D6D05_09790 [Aureobasidium pullulans]TIA12464.1 hypothetical protein D6C80_06833 [Aureobasidium pullulans]TIA44070.1 hypothetical protein D6C79_06601 [Aureobasidium pullulans]